MENQTVKTCQGTVNRHFDDTSRHFANPSENTPNPQVKSGLQTVLTVLTLTPPEGGRLRGVCAGRWPGWTCTAGLHPHNVTGLCAECKLILRNERLSGVPADPTAFVTPEQAAANIAAVFGRIR